MFVLSFCSLCLSLSIFFLRISIESEILKHQLVSLQLYFMANQKGTHTGILLLTLFLFASVGIANTWNETISINSLQGVFQGIFCGKGSCTDNSQCQKNRQYIASLQESGYFDLSKEPISNNQYNIKAATFSDIQTQGYFQWQNTAKNGIRKMSGLLVLPETKGPIRGIVVSFHGTLFSKNQAPSNHISFNAKYRATGALFASRNLAVLFPDYPGFGTDAQNAHPYVIYPQQNIRSAMLLLNAALPVLKQKYVGISESTPLPVFSTGYSEGGAYGVWFGACNSPALKRKYTYCNKGLELNKAYKVAGISGSAGAYDADLSNEYEISQVDGSGKNFYKIGNQVMANAAKPGFSLLSIFAYATYNPKPVKLSQLLVDQFYNMRCSADIQSKEKCNIKDHPHMTIEQALFLDDSDFSSVSDAILYSALSKKSNGQTYLSGNNWPTQINNSFLALLNQQKLFTKEFYKACNDSSIVTFGKVTPFPLFLYTLNQDSMVTPLHTENFIKSKNEKVQSYFLNSTIFKTCDSDFYQKTDHIGGYAVSSIFVLNFYQQVLKSLNQPSEEL